MVDVRALSGLCDIDHLVTHCCQGVRRTKLNGLEGKGYEEGDCSALP